MINGTTHGPLLGNTQSVILHTYTRLIPVAYTRLGVPAYIPRILDGCRRDLRLASGMASTFWCTSAPEFPACGAPTSDNLPTRKQNVNRVGHIMWHKRRGCSVPAI